MYNGQPVVQRRRSVTPPEKAELPNWIDWVVFLVVMAVGILSVALTLISGGFNISELTDTTLSWHLVRSAGLVSYTLLAASTLWGFLLHSRLVKDWSPGPLSMILHAATSWLATVLALAHMGLLLFDKYYTYRLADLLVPFVGPYRPLAVGLGVIAFWVILAINISFSVRRLIGQRAWRWLHYTSYVTFGLVTVHALASGTDADRLGMKIILLGCGFIVAFLVAWRLSGSGNKPAVVKQNGQS